MRLNGSTIGASMMTLVLGVGYGMARADQLLMEDGRILTGTVSRSGSTHQLVNSNGTATDYPKDEVDRWVDVAEVTPTDALAMIREG